MWKFLNRIKRTYESFQRHDGDLIAAAVAYYAALAFFPLLLVLIAGLGFFLSFTHLGQSAEQHVLSAIAEYASSSVRDDVKLMLEQVQTNAVIGGPIGMIVLLFTAVAMFAQFEHAFDRIWDKEPIATDGVLAFVRHVLLYRLKAFLMLLFLGVLVFAVFLAGMALTTLKTYTQGYLPAAEWTWWFVQIAVGVMLNSVVFTITYRVLPRVSVRWTEALQGGILTAVVWEIGRLLLAAFLIGGKFSAYGIVGSFIAVMLWIYYASSVLFLGAEYVQVLYRERSGQSAVGSR